MFDSIAYYVAPERKFKTFIWKTLGDYQAKLI